MNNIEKIKELTRDLEKELEGMPGNMNLEQTRKVLLISECITARIQAYFFKFLTKHAENAEKKPIDPLPAFYR